MRKNFSYKDSTVAEIVEHFKQSTPQAIYNARYTWSDTSITAKVEEAYREYKIAMLDAKLSKK